MPNAVLGPLFAMIAVTLFSFNDVVMKFISDDYALHQAVLIRSLTGFCITVGIMAPLMGGFHLLKTDRLGMQSLRAAFVIGANMNFFLGLAALPLATNVAIFFVSQFLVVLASIIVLGEAVGPRRWLAVFVGMLGVFFVLRPGTETFQWASLFPLGAAFCYAGLNIMTRYLKDTENAVNLVFYIQVIFFFFCALVGLAVGDGKFADQESASLAFLFREWIWPPLWDWPYLIVIGFFASVGGWFISEAYRIGEVGLVAPFEYIALPFSVIWGIVLFSEYPDAITYFGIALILGAGLFIVLRERQLARET